MRGIEAKSVHTCITSPPYWGLRRYLPEGDPLTVHELGNETVPDCNGAFTGQPCTACWVCKLVAVCREVRRVLRPDGTLWLNVGDAYTSGNRVGHGTRVGYKQQTNRGMNGSNDPARAPTPAGLKAKDLCMLPARLALALQADGWWLRSEIIWHKICAMPESVRDRPTKAHEQVYLLTRRPTYFFDACAIREPAVKGDAGSRFDTGKTGVNGNGRVQPGYRATPVEAGRSCRSVWPLASEPTPFRHFATMPSALVRRCLLASCSAGGVCAGCGRQTVRQVERYRTHNGERRDDLGAWRNPDPGAPIGAQGDGHWRYATVMDTTGFAPACACNAGVQPPTVLDPFMGSGTTLLTARDLFIKSIGVELNPTYCALAASRLTQGVLALAPGTCEHAGPGERE